MLSHADIWRAIDLLAERHGFSPSGLAKRAGLSATVFNPSKRVCGGRKRWPSTEILTLILKATGTDWHDFVALVQKTPRETLPLVGWDEAQEEGPFDEAGHLIAEGRETVGLMPGDDPHLFVLEVGGKQGEPFCRDGERLLLSPGTRPRRGDRVALRSEKGSLCLGRLRQETAAKIEIQPFASAAAPLVFQRRDVAWVYTIVGLFG